MSVTRCAIYARFSSDRQNERSAEDQVSDCRRHADREGWQVVEVYTDLAISGASNRRPGMMALLADAAAGAFDVVLAEDQDRITRDLEDSAAIYKRLTFADVELWTLSGGRVDELKIGFKGTMDALELRKIGEKVRRGQRGNLSRGRVPGGLTYGYDVVRVFDERGRVDAGRRRINPDQAAIVVRIFEEVAAGRSPRAIAHDLNAEGSGRLGAASGGPRRSSATARARWVSCTTRSTSAASSTDASPAGAIRRLATACGA
jgi:site-specific DNA recombinase